MFKPYNKFVTLWARVEGVTLFDSFIINDMGREIGVYGRNDKLHLF